MDENFEHKVAEAPIGTDQAQVRSAEESQEITLPNGKGLFASARIWQVVSAILLLVLVFSLVKANGITGAATADSVKAETLSYINENLLQDGSKATVKSVAEGNGLYVITLDIGGNEFESYVSTDGKLLFPSAIDMTQPVPVSQPQPSQPAPKSDKPKVDLYVMSFCPYGNQAEDTMLPVYKLLKGKVDFNIKYIVNANKDQIQSLHGQTEVDQDARELAVAALYGKDKLWEFMAAINSKCGRDGSCWETEAKNIGMDAKKIKDYVDKQGTEALKKEAQDSGTNGVSGSPTMMINGVETQSVYEYGNSEAYKQAICSAFNNPPAECSNALSAGSGASAPSGSCG